MDEQIGQLQNQSYNVLRANVFGDDSVIISDKEMIADISTLLDDRVVDFRVIQRLTVSDDKLIHYESELWDYKQDLSGGNGKALKLARTVKQIVSFYNAHGGYLIYGVADDGTIRGEAPQIDVDQLEKKCEWYLGERIRLVSSPVVKTVNGSDHSLQILCIPKRELKSTPISFVRNGPEKSAGEPVFLKQDIYFRNRDTCVPCRRQDDYIFLFGERDVVERTSRSQKPVTKLPLRNTLPDKHQICSNLIGRSESLIKLWRWLSEDFSSVKVLTGIGGNGKSSIAYEFAQQVCLHHPLEFGNVFWLTAKTKRYIGNEGRFDTVLETHFRDLDSLMIAFAEKVCLRPDEIEDVTYIQQCKVLKDAFELFPCFIVIDDIDSLPTKKDQRELINFIMQISGHQTRFLLTTRLDALGSGDTYNITVDGLNGDDYRRFFWETFDRAKKRSSLKLKINNKQLDRIEKRLDGSPLYTEDFVRQLQTNLSLERALASWKSEDGDDVRRATLHKETEMLDVHSKRVLYALCLMGDASETELKQVTGCKQSMFAECLDKLDAFYLLNAPSITETERRFSVRSNTSLLVLNSEDPFVADFKSLRNSVKRLNVRLSQKGNSAIRLIVGKAINQANAQMNGNKPDAALETVDTALKSQKDNRDLLLMRARIMMRFDPPRRKAARANIEAAYKLDQRKRELFDIWYDLENKSENPSAMVEVASKAIDRISNTLGFEWLIKRAHAHVYLGSNYFESGSDACFRSYRNALKDLIKARSQAADADDDNIVIGQLQKLCFVFHNCVRKFSDFNSGVQAFDFWLLLLEKRIFTESTAGFAADSIEHIWRVTLNPTIKTYSLVTSMMNKLLQQIDRLKWKDEKWAIEIRDRMNSLFIKVEKVKVRE